MSSRAVRQEARRFDDDADRRLAQIAAELRAERFAFGASRGVAVARPGKRPRPLVIAPLEARVVARALLDVLQSTPAVAASFLTAPTSFGGLPGRGVEQAVSAALAAVSRGAVFYVRTDIADFFRTIPRDDALSALSAAIDDPVVRRLADLATRTGSRTSAPWATHAPSSRPRRRASRRATASPRSSRTRCSRASTRR